MAGFYAATRAPNAPLSGRLLRRPVQGATDRSDPTGRLRLLDANLTVFASIVPKLVKAASDAVILVLTDPPEPLIDVTRHLCGHDRVIGMST